MLVRMIRFLKGLMFLSYYETNMNSELLQIMCVAQMCADILFLYSIDGFYNCEDSGGVNRCITWHDSLI